MLRAPEHSFRGERTGGSATLQPAGDRAQRQTGEGHRPGSPVPGTAFPLLMASQALRQAVW